MISLRVMLLFLTTVSAIYPQSLETVKDTFAGDEGLVAMRANEFLGKLSSITHYRLSLHREIGSAFLVITHMRRRDSGVISVETVMYFNDGYLTSDVARVTKKIFREEFPKTENNERVYGAITAMSSNGFSRDELKEIAEKSTYPNCFDGGKVEFGKEPDHSSSASWLLGKVKVDDFTFSLLRSPFFGNYCQTKIDE